MKSLISDLNLKSLTLTVIAVFVFIFASDFVIHGVLMKDLYQQTANLWRTEDDMHSNMIFMLLSEFLMAKGISVLFAKGYEGKGVMEGVRFALFLAPLILAPNFMTYAVTPLPGTILACWLLACMVQVVLASMVAALVYKK